MERLWKWLWPNQGTVLTCAWGDRKKKMVSFVSWLRFEPDISKIKSETLPDKPTCLAGRIY